MEMLLLAVGTVVVATVILVGLGRYLARRLASTAPDPAGPGEPVGDGVAAEPTDADGNTALHLAFYNQRAEEIAFQVDQGADEQRRNRFGLLPADMPRLAEAEWLLRRGADAMSPVGSWTNETAGRIACTRLRRLPTDLFLAALERVGTSDPARKRAVLLAIKLGIPGTEEVLNELLWRLGDHAIAEIYLNCGSPQLRAYGEAWLVQHGYTIVSGTGYHYVAWGSI